jgi:hypothetical protein
MLAERGLVGFQESSTEFIDFGLCRVRIMHPAQKICVRKSPMGELRTAKESLTEKGTALQSWPTAIAFFGHLIHPERISFYIAL